MTDGRLPEKCCECGQLIEHTDDSPVVRGDLTLRPGFQTAEWRGSAVRIPAQPFQLLLFLARRGGDFARKEAIYTAVFEPLDRDGPDPKIVDVQVCKLRTLLATVGAGGIVRTEWGKGYSLDLTNGSLPQQVGQMRRSAKKE